MGMHHVENNLEDDASSTMGYQRDSLRDFFAYFFNFLFLGLRDTVMYLYNRKRKKLYMRLTVGEAVFIFFAFYVLCKSESHPARFYCAAVVCAPGDDAG